jgi:GMP synthase (glutamine-hydrolysing)
MSLPEQELVVVLDFGGQYSHLIARRIRELKVFCEMLPYSTSIDEIKAKRPRGIIFSGGPSSVYQEKAPACDPALYETGIPVLGICYGMQLMAQQLGGVVSRSGHREYGKTGLHVLERDRLLSCMEQLEQCWMSHGDRVESAPPGFTVSAAPAIITARPRPAAPRA